MKSTCRTYLMEQFGDEAVVAEIYGEYVSSTARKLAECGQALGVQDWTTLDRAAHALKGNALAAGDGEMANEAVELRLEAKLQDVSKATVRLARIRELSSRL